MQFNRMDKIVSLMLAGSVLFVVYVAKRDYDKQYKGKNPPAITMQQSSPVHR